MESALYAAFLWARKVAITTRKLGKYFLSLWE